MTECYYNKYKTVVKAGCSSFRSKGGYISLKLKDEYHAHIMEIYLRSKMNLIMLILIHSRTQPSISMTECYYKKHKTAVKAGCSSFRIQHLILSRSDSFLIHK